MIAELLPAARARWPERERRTDGFRPHPTDSRFGRRLTQDV
jgi:hypothetical protein